MTHFRVAPFFLATLLGSLFCHTASAASNGGVGLSATRMIFPTSSKEERMGIKNTSDKSVFLMQSWISDEHGNKSTDFVITPPLFVLKPGKEGSLRVTRARTQPLPSDRESLYYLNSKAIPATDKTLAQGNSVLQIATQSIIKVFVRPVGLKMDSKDAPGKVKCQLSGGKLTLRNDSPYYVTLVNININGKPLKNTMIAPFSSVLQQSPTATGTVTFQTVNDYGAITPAQACK